MFEFKYLNKKLWIAFFVTYMLACIVPFVVTLYISSEKNDKVRESVHLRDSKIYEIISKETTDMVSKTMQAANKLGEEDDLNNILKDKVIDEQMTALITQKLSGINNVNLKKSYLYIKSKEIIVDSDGNKLTRAEFENEHRKTYENSVNLDKLLYALDVQALLYKNTLLVSAEILQYSNIRLISEYDLSAFVGENNSEKYDQYLKDMGVVFYSGSMSLVIGLIIGMLMIFFIARRNFTYFSKMASKIKDSSSISHEVNINDLSEYMEKESIQFKTKMQDITMQQHVLSELLQGKIEWENISSDGMLQSHGVEFVSNNFVVVVFYVEDFENLFENDPVQDVDKQIQTVEFLLKNVTEELMAENRNKGFVTHYNNLSVMIISITQDNTQEVIENVKFAQKFLKENLGITFSAGVSNIKKDLAGIQKAYKEALNAIEYRDFLGGEQVIPATTYDEYHVVYNYSVTKEQQLTNYIKNGGCKEAKELVAELFEQNFKDNLGAIEISKCLAFDMVGTMLKIADESNDVEIRTNEVLKEVIKWQSVGELQEAIFKFIDEMCKKEDTDKGFCKIKEQVMKYIERNYIDSDLSVGLIADSVGLHTSYLSTLYKENTGEGLLEVISKFRIEKAKQLICCGKMKLEDIAKKVGYSNSKTFTRVFKKYEGITPAKYRDINYNSYD